LWAGFVMLLPTPTNTCGFWSGEGFSWLSKRFRIGIVQNAIEPGLCFCSWWRWM
jgi:predicted glycosyl hydrolase (DUF1957 family)